MSIKLRSDCILASAVWCVREVKLLLDKAPFIH